MQKGLYLHPCIRFIMKISAITLIVQLTLTGMLFANSANSQDLNKIQLNLKLKNAGLKECFQTLQKQTGIKFSFGEALIKRNEKKTSISARQISMETALKLILDETNLRCIQIGNNLIIDEKPAPPKPATPPIERIVTGTVTADDIVGPLPGVTVQLKGTNKRTATTLEGKYSIAVDNDQSILVFSYMGYVAQEIAVGNSASLNVILKTDRQSLNEIVVIGYGTSRKQDLSAAVATVPDMDKIKDRPVLNVASMIQGKVPGVTAINDGGHPNKSPKITIRGVGSRKNENVLYVVDGVPNAPYNPADVESITILKDAASAAIYGAFSGSAGVILITTRQAKQGSPSVEYSGFTGLKNAWRLPHALTAENEAKVANLALTNSGSNPSEGWDITKNPYAQVTRTDWMNEIFRTGLIQRHNVSINAGTEKFSNLIQGRYEREEGTLLNTYNQNLSLRFNSNYQFTKNIKLRQEVFWNNNDNRGTETESGYSGTILSAIYMPSSATPYYPDGSFGGVGPRDSNYLGIHGDVINPVATLLRNKPYNKTNDLQSVTELSVSDIIPGLSVLSRFSYRKTNSLWKNFEPKRTEPGKPNSQNTLTYETNNNFHWIWENTANYSRTFNRHSIGAMASMTAQDQGVRRLKVIGKGFETEEEWAQYFINATIFDQNKPEDKYEYDRNASYVGRLSYSWADRYFVTGSYRYDMAGRIAKDYRGKGLPGVTAAWKLSSEPFFHIDGVDLIKFRASWGRIGNMASIEDLGYGYPRLSANYTNQIGDGAPRSNSLSLGSLFNPQLTWETSEQKDIGFDFSFLNQRLSITGDYFNKLTYDLIKEKDTEWTNTFGLGAPLINQGKIRNTGYELAATWKDNAGALSYDFGANIATLKNRVEYIDENPQSFWLHTDNWRTVLRPFRSIVGQPYYSYWLIKNEGIFQSDAEANAYVKDGKKIQPDAKAGDFKFRDLNNDGKIDDADRSYMGSAAPKLTYGFTTNLAWKNFDFSMFLQGVSGVKLFHAFKQSTLNGSEQGYNRWDKILDAWSPENTGSNIPRISASDKNQNFQTASDWYLEDGDYLRIKSVILGYTFKNMPFKSSLRIFVGADNLVTFTKYTGMDPEVGGIGLDGGQFPLSRIYTFGLKLKL